MKTVQFETTKVHGLFVNLPELQPNGKLYISGMNFLCYTWLKDIKRRRMVLSDEPLPKGYNWQLQGFITNLTDEQKEVVCKDADEFASLLESLKVFAFNLYGIEEPELNPVCCGLWQDDGHGNPKCCDNPIPCIASQEASYLWQTAQEHVGNYILLIANK